MSNSTAEPNRDTPSAQPPEDPALRNPPLRIVVVDDLADAADGLAILLRMLGYSVRIAYDGASALALSSEFRPHVVLLDIGLPKLDGYEVAAFLRQQPEMQSLCLIAVSGFGSEADRQRSRRAGFDHHLLKPLKLTELTAILDRQAGVAS